MKRVVLWGVLALLGVGLYIASLPDELHVERQIVIQASPEAIFPCVDNHRRWSQWSPCMAMDPEATYLFESPETSVDALTHWDGDKGGVGYTTTMANNPPVCADYQLDFLEPFIATHTGVFGS